MDLRRRKWAVGAGAMLSALYAVPSNPAAAATALPPWTARALRADERVASFDTCGADCYLIFACTGSDTLAGRLIRASRSRKMIAYSEQYAWLRSDLACPGDVVRVRNAIPLTEARAVLDAVRPRLLAGEHVGEIHALGSVHLEDGRLVEYDTSDAIGVSLRCPGATGGRELTVRRTTGGLVVEVQGVKPD